MWMNEHEIDSLSRQFDKDEFPNLRAGAESLQRLKDWTNGCSDGWPYWTLPAKAASKLMAKLHEEANKRWSLLEDITDAELRQLMAPIEKFLTSRGDDPYTVLNPPPPPPPGRRTVTAVVRVTIEPTAAVEYSGDDLADEIRDRVFRAVTEGVPYDVIVMTVEGSV